jgi:hypothetical protein
MQWYEWKIWRFAWSPNANCMYATDASGGWVRFCGNLFYLKYPKRR